MDVGWIDLDSSLTYAFPPDFSVYLRDQSQILQVF